MVGRSCGRKFVDVKIMEDGEAVPAAGDSDGDESARTLTCLVLYLSSCSGQLVYSLCCSRPFSTTSGFRAIVSSRTVAAEAAMHCEHVLTW